MSLSRLFGALLSSDFDPRLTPLGFILLPLRGWIRNERGLYSLPLRGCHRPVGLANCIDQCSDSGDGDSDFVAGQESERVRGDGSGAGEQKTACRKTVAAKQILHQ